jgi:hypothetical protein
MNEITQYNAPLSETFKFLLLSQDPNIPVRNVVSPHHRRFLKPFQEDGLIVSKLQFNFNLSFYTLKN